MNIVDVIKGQLSDDVLGKLGSLVGESEEKTKAAVGAAVPGLLAILAKLASTTGGAEKVINSLKQVQQEAPEGGGLGDILAGPRAPEIQEKGTSLINILLGSAALPVIINLLSKFAGVAAGSAKGLLGYLLPVILSMVAKQMSGRGLNPAALSSFFAEQKGNISSALPPGFSLPELPGLGAVSAAPRAVVAPAPAESGMPSWLLPLVGLGVVGLLAWWFFGQSGEPVVENPPVGQAPARPGPAKVAPAPAAPTKAADAAAKAVADLPDPAKLSGDLTGIYNSLTEMLGGVKDVPTAEATAPKLTELTPKLDGLKSLWDKLPDAGKATVTKVTTDSLAKLKELIAKVLAIPGVSEKLKPVLDTIVAKLAALAVS